MPEHDPSCFNGLLTLGDDNIIRDYDGYILARHENGYLIWIDSRNKDGRIRRRLEDVVSVKAALGEYHAYNVTYVDGFTVTYYGQKEDSNINNPIPIRYGGKIHDMDSIIRYCCNNPEGYLWKDYLSGDNYIDTSMIEGNSGILLTCEATIGVRQFVEEKSWQIWEGKALNVTRSDVQDYLDEIANKTVKNPFLDKIDL